MIADQPAGGRAIPRGAVVIQLLIDVLISQEVFLITGLKDVSFSQ
ncbi:hypothetical protein [Agrobacterium tumefaciens]|jgi:hypothetical protein